MLKRFFITGTDTSVGKTVVSRALLQALASGGKSVAGYKPVAKGTTSMDFTLPVLQRTGGLDMVPAAIVHGFILSLLVPILIAFFSA